MTLDQMLDELLLREGGYVNHPADKGGPTTWGITRQVARAFGYAGDMQALSRETAKSIYKQRYWTAPGYEKLAAVSSKIAEKLFDVGVNMGPATGTKFLQRALNGLNAGGTHYADVTVDGGLGALTLAAVKGLFAKRGADGETALLRLINAQQAVRYLELAERSPSQEAFLFGWVLNRVQ